MCRCEVFRTAVFFEGEAFCGAETFCGTGAVCIPAVSGRLMPQAVLLLPGVGAQGGSVAELTRAFTSGPASAIVNASRSVNYAFRDAGGDFREAAGAEAARLKREIWAASGW